MENVNDLPIEVLTRIFDFLSLCERKHASAVCTLWYNILHCTRFQRQCRLFLDGPFEEKLTELEKRVLQSCRNLSITHWDESSDDEWEDDDEQTIAQRETEDIIQLKYLFKPTPEANLTDLLFGHELDLECLELYSTFESSRDIIEDRLPQMTNLKDLSLSFDRRRVSSGRTIDTSNWVINHNRIETLRIELSFEPKPFQIIAPNLTSLELKPNCRWNLEIIETYSRQLQYLRVQFQDAESMDTMLSLAFPSLIHLQVRMMDDKDTQIRYSRTRHQMADEDKCEQFVRGMPRLKKLMLESNLMFFRIGVALTRFARYLEELVMEELQIDYPQLKVVEALPKLKILTLFRCEVLMSPPMLPVLNLPRLENLSLIHNESNIVFGKGLAGLKSLKISVWTQKNHKVLYKICNNLPNLEHLEVRVNDKFVNTALRHLNRLTKLKSLKFDDIEPNPLLWVHCPVVPTVRRVVFYNCTLKMSTLQPIAKLFPALSELFLDRCYFKYSSEDGESEDDDDGEDDNDGDDENDEDANGQSLSIVHVRELFPLCRVSLKKSFFCKKPC